MKSILITGAGSGIGLEATKLFLRKGYKVGAFDLNVDALKDVIGEYGEDRIKSYVCDVTRLEDVQKRVGEFVSFTGGTIDVVLSNAGILFTGPFLDIDAKKYRAMVDVNVMGMVHMAYATVEYLKKSKGVLVMTSSASAIVGIPYYGVYGASKAFTTSLGECLSFELEKEGVHVALIEPEIVQTPMTSGDKGNLFEVAKNVKLKAVDVAEVQWKASQDRSKLYWLVGSDAKAIALINRLPYRLKSKVLKKILNSKYD